MSASESLQRALFKQSIKDSEKVLHVQLYVNRYFSQRPGDMCAENDGKRIEAKTRNT